MSYFLSGSDYVGVSFWLVYAAMIASTVFFFYEGFHVKKEWRLSLLVAGLVTLVAAIHYDYMRDYWVYTLSQGEGQSPIVYRYIDWLITVPLLMIEFYIILKAVGASVSANSFWRLLIGTLVMLIGGYLGETGLYGVGATFGFIIGMPVWDCNSYRIVINRNLNTISVIRSIELNVAIVYKRLFFTYILAFSNPYYIKIKYLKDRIMFYQL